MGLNEVPSLFLITNAQCPVQMISGALSSWMFSLVLRPCKHHLCCYNFSYWKTNTIKYCQRATQPTLYYLYFDYICFDISQVTQSLALLVFLYSLYSHLPCIQILPKIVKLSLFGGSLSQGSLACTALLEQISLRICLVCVREEMQESAMVKLVVLSQDFIWKIHSKSLSWISPTTEFNANVKRNLRFFQITHSSRLSPSAFLSQVKNLRFDYITLTRWLMYGFQQSPLHTPLCFMKL